VVQHCSILYPQAVAKSIEKNILSHGRQLLVEWKARHEAQFGVGSWAADGGPDAETVGLHRLAEETLLMSDTCNGARKCKRLLKEAAEAASKAKIGEVAWEAMTEAERAKQCKSYFGDCQSHLRNILINAMSLKATEVLQDELADDLAAFSAFDRMSVDGRSGCVSMTRYSTIQ
jgi:hypothetical protein